MEGGGGLAREKERMSMKIVLRFLRGGIKCTTVRWVQQSERGDASVSGAGCEAATRSLDLIHQL